MHGRGARTPSPPVMAKQALDLVLLHFPLLARSKPLRRRGRRRRRRRRMLATSSPATNRSEWKSVDGPSYRRLSALCFEVKLFVISRVEYFSSCNCCGMAWYGPFEMIFNPQYCAVGRGRNNSAIIAKPKKVRNCGTFCCSRKIGHLRFLYRSDTTT